MAKYVNRFIAIDNETGGLLKKGVHATIDVALTETAAVVVDNESLEIIGEHSWLIQPYDDGLIYEKGAEIASGISRQMCEESGVGIDIVYEGLKKVLVDNKVGRNKPIIVMQNRDFDSPFIENLFKIFGDDFFKYIERIEDTLHWGHYKWVEKPNFKLGSLAEYCGIDLVQAHRALPDTVTTAKVWVHYMKCLRGGGSVEQKESFREGFRF